jgi:hypothetical protein
MSYRSARTRKPRLPVPRYRGVTKHRNQQPEYRLPYKVYKLPYRYSIRYSRPQNDTNTGPILRNLGYGLDFQKRLSTAVVFCQGSPPWYVVRLGTPLPIRRRVSVVKFECVQAARPENPVSITSRGNSEDGVGSNADGIDVRIPDGKGNS